MIFTLEALKAKDGDCLLLHYNASNDAKKTSLILIDGGPAGVFKDTLEPRLNGLKRSNGVVPIEIALVSHIDADHITGIVDLFRMLKDKLDGSQDLPYRIRTLWHNSFEIVLKKTSAAMVADFEDARAVAAGVVPAGINGSPMLGAVAASVKQGNDLRSLATQLGIPINQKAKGPVVMAQSDQGTRIELGALTFTVFGPHQAEMDRLEKEWLTATKEGKTRQAAFAADYLNRTAANLSSIVILAEMKNGARTTRMLLTGDAGGDLMMEALEGAGLLPANGSFHIDLLKVQHHGSRHSVDETFFRRVTADHYVISGNGKHENPHREVLEWLSNARKDARYDVHLTYRSGVEGLTGVLDKFLRSESARPNHRYHFREDPANSIAVHLGVRAW